MLSIGSLFSGIGGLELGLEWATGGRTVWNCEIDPFCRRVLAKHWPDATQYEDISSLKETARVDILCGGFPCQNISVFGDRTGLAGDKSGLWREYARVIRAIRPRFVFVENVPALRTLASEDGMGAVMRDLAEAGYDTEWDCVPAAAVGAPHVRDRLFILGHREELLSERREIPVPDFPPPPFEDPEPWLLGHPDACPVVAQPKGVDRRARLKALGNAVVPHAAAAAWMRFVAPSRPSEEFAVLEDGRWRVPRGVVLDLFGGDAGEGIYDGAWPRAGSVRAGRAGECVGSFPTPSRDARLWPTPAASTPNDGEDPAQWLRRFVEVASRDTGAMRTGVPLSLAARAPVLLRVARAGALGEAADLLSRHEQSPTTELTSQGHLNPTWVEHLMGFRAGWTDLSRGAER